MSNKYVYELRVESFYRDNTKPTALTTLFARKKDALSALELDLKIYADEYESSGDPVLSDEMSLRHYFAPTERQKERGVSFVCRCVERKQLY